MSIRKLKARGIGRLELLMWLNRKIDSDYIKVNCQLRYRRILTYKKARGTRGWSRLLQDPKYALSRASNTSENET